MEKKFDINGRSRVFSNIADSMAEAPAQDAQEEQNNVGRKAYNEEETKRYMEEFRTQGRKGLHMDRMNMAFAPEIYEFIRVMSRASGVSATAYVNGILYGYMVQNREKYDKVKELLSYISNMEK